MNDQDKTQQELENIQEELKTTGMSRRKFLNRLKVAGVGFGAFAVLGNEAAQAHTGDAVSLNSTNPAIGNIIDDGRAEANPEGEENTQLAQYGRYYRRYYRRGYRRYYRRGYRRYGRYHYRRYYRRYGRFYF
jgi:hypothetical protein